MSQHNPNHAHPHYHYPSHATPLALQQQQQHQEQQQHGSSWYSHVASYPAATHSHPLSHSAFGPAPPCKASIGIGNNNSNPNTIMGAYGGGVGVGGGGGSHGYFGAAGGGLNVSGAGGGAGSSYGLGANTVAYAHNQLLQYQHHQQHNQQQQQAQQQQHQHLGMGQRSYMGHDVMAGSYPYIKSEPLEGFQQPPNPMAPPPAPEMIIKSEPIDDLAYKSNYIDDNTPFADFSKFSEFSEDMLSPKVELTVKDESFVRNPNSFLRRKQQSDLTTAESLPVCQRCKEVFFKKQTYLRHVAESNCGIQEYDFKCTICPMSFMTAEELHLHKQQHRADRFFCHKYCGKHFGTIAECEAHEYMQHEYENIVCNMCSGSFATREQLYAHLPQHKFQQRFDCPVCRLWYQTALELHEHRLAAPYFCGKYYTGGQSPSPSSQQQQHQSQTNYKLQDCHMATMESKFEDKISCQEIICNSSDVSPVPSAPLLKANTNNSPALPATAALNSLLQQRQANADGAPIFAASSLKNEVAVKLERSYSNSTSESSYSVQESGYNNVYGSSDSSVHGAIAGPQAHSSTLDDSEDALCCVPLCGVRKSTSPTLQFFTFPKDEKYLNQWLHNLKMFHIPASSYVNFRICSMHFPKRCINRYSLCYWAVPTFNLGHDDVANLYQNRELTNTFTTGEVARCSMPHCTSQRGESNLKFYNFPKDIKSLIKWCQNARLPVQAKEPRHFCSRHFEERCIGKFRLKPWAVPTLHLGAQYGKIHDNPKNLYVEEKRCCLNFCRRSRSSDFNMSLYRFPRDEVLLRRWCYNLRLDPGVYRGKNHKICSAHFIKEALGLRKLSPGAVPTLHLGHNDTFNIYENELWPPPTPTPSSCHIQQQQQQSSLHSLQQQMHSKSYQRRSVASTSSSASSAASHYVDPEISASYHLAMSASAGGSATINASDSMDVCCVPSCESKRHNSENITFHTIPRRPEQMRKWCHNLKIPEDKMHKGMRICSLHFEPYCIGGCMRPFAVPTLHLGHDDEDIHRNPDVIKKLNIRETCCVAVCKRNRDRDHANLHRFPSNVALLKKWCANLQRSVPDGSKLFNDAICEVHFEDRCLRNKRLEKWAVPTLVLGHEDIPYPLPTPEQVTEFYARPTAPNNGEEQGECCVETCKRNPSVDDIKLYRPPEDASVLAKWAHNLQTEANQLTSMRICNLHFEAHCIGKRMRQWAIPTLNLAGNIENLYENPEQSMLYRRRTHLKAKLPPASAKPTWVPRCCLPHCRKVRALHNVQLYRFPKLNRSTLAKWAHNLQVPMVGSAQRRLCSAHFEPHVLSKKCPVPLAVPTLDLNSPPGLKIYQNPAKLKASKLCLQRVCIVESCRKTRAQGVQLFRLPHSPTQLRKWMHNIRTRPRAAMRAQYRVCSRHFETHSFNGRRLSAGAIPTLELGHDSDDIYPNEAQAFVDEHCAVEGCEASKDQPEVRLFRFPTDDDDMLWKWCNNLKMNPVDCIGVRICNKHFEADCIGPKHLFKWAIPTQELGHDDAQIELILNPKPEERYVDPVFKCIVPTCGKTRRFDEVQMNSFPKDPDLFQRWKHNLRLEHLSFQERERYKICNDHFEEICIGKTRLNIGSVPTLELGHDDVDDIFQVNPAELQSNLFGRQRRLLLEGSSGELSIKQELSETEENNKADVTATGSHSKQIKIKRSNSDLKCCVHSCGRSRLEHGARLFPFPTGKQQHLKWRHNLHLEPEEVDRSTRVCSAHFNRRCIEGKQLRSWAMPTQQLGHNDQPIYENPKNIPGFFTPTCALGHCRKRRSIDNDLRTYRYPRSEDLLEKWRANLRLAPDQCRGRICANHFEPQVRGKLKLKTGAVPTLQLGHDEGLVYDNEAIKAGMTEEEEGIATEFPRLKPKQEVFEEEGEGNDGEQEHPDDQEDNADEEDKDDHYFDPLELVETFAENRSDDEAQDYEDEEDDDQAKDSPSGYDVKEEIEQLPSTPPSPLPRRHQIPRREKPANNVTPICCLKHCRKERTAFHLLSTFGFPKDRQLLLKWCANLHLNPDDCVGRVCIEHFQPEVLGTRKLKQNAVPTLNVGHEEPLRYSCHGVDQNLEEQDPQPQHSVFRLWSLKHCRKRKLTEPPDIPLAKRRALEMPMIKREWEMEMQMEQKKEAMKMTQTESESHICCVSSCGSQEASQLLAFPEDKFLQRKWSHNLRLRTETDTTSLSSKRVCLAHFESQLLENGKFTKEAEAEAVPTLNLGHSSWNIYRNNGVCLVPDCTHNTFGSSSFIDLPDNSIIRDACFSCLNLPDPCEEQARLCRIHFLQAYSKFDPPKVLNPQVIMALQSALDELQCAVPGWCFEDADPDFHLIQLPEKKELLTKWLHNTKIPYDPSRHQSYRICTLHFEPEYLDSNGPLKGAIPTLHLNHEEEIHLNTGPLPEEQDSMLTPLRIKTDPGFLGSPCESASPSPRGRIRICCIPTCGQFGSSQVRLFRFPTEEQALLRWLVNTRQQPRLVDPMDLYVCQAHFEPEAICMKQLRSWAEPTLNLGHDGYVIPNAKHNGNISDSQDTEQAMRFIRENFCSVISCFQARGQEEEEGVRLFDYPEDMATTRKWAAACRHRSMQARSHGFKVCQLHFAKECFDPTTGELIEGAVPTLELSRDEMERQCLVAGCVKNNDNGIRLRYFKIPKVAAQLEAWSNNLKVHPAELMQGEQQYICEKHFEAFCFGANKGLRSGALPTLLLGHDDEVDMLPNPEALLCQNKADKCCVPGCGNVWQTGDRKFRGFPKLLAMAKKWRHNLRLEAPVEQLGRLKVCSAHFEITSPNLGTNGLSTLSTSIPTLQLGHSSPDIYPADVSLKFQKRSGMSAKIYCCYPKCEEVCLPKNLSYGLPQEENLRNAWLSHMDIEDPKDDGVALLCPLHYVILYQHGAAHYPEHHASSQVLLDDNYKEARNNRRVKIVSCTIKGCDTVKPRDGVPLHGMPQCKDILQMWIKNGQFEFIEQQRYMFKVCHNHFEPCCFFDDRRLHSWSVPTLRLPGDAIHQNPTAEQWQNMIIKQAAAKTCAEENQEPDPYEVVVKTEPILQMEHIESEYEDENPESQALEVLLEVGHVERMESYEKMDKSPVIYSDNAPFRYSPIRCPYNANHCAVKGCKVTAEDVDGTIKLHKFPASQEAAQKWMHNTQVDMDEKFWWRYRICSYHFEQECFQSARIRKGAMPTLLLGPRRPDKVYDNEFSLPEGEEPFLEPEETQLEESTTVTSIVRKEVSNLCLPPRAPPRKSSKFCQIDSCSNHLTTENMTLHKFPHSEDMCLKWQHNTQVPFDPFYRWRYRICSAHFHPVCLVNMRLVHGSVPTLKLGPKAPAELFDNDFEAINLRLDKRLTESNANVYIKHERREDDEDSMVFLEPELQLHEDQDDKISSWNNKLQSTPVKQEKIMYSQIKSGYDKCSLAHCQRQRSQHGVHIYKFPRSRRQQERWMHNLRIRYDERTPWKFMICSVHFEPHCVSLRKLRPWAVPTLELGDNVPETIFTNEQCEKELVTDRSDLDSEAEEEDGLQEDDDDDEEDDVKPDVSGIKRRRRFKIDSSCPSSQIPPWKVKQCCLPYCRAFRGDGIKLFRLPNNRNSISNWERATGMVFKESQRNTRLICSRHFEPQLIGVRRLMRNAIPTKHLHPKAVEQIPTKKEKNPPATVTPICCMADCHYNGNVKLHKFPSDPSLLKQWCQALRLTDTQRYLGKHICSMHLPMNKTVSCVICGGDNVELPMLGFPENRNQRAKWCYNLKIETIPKWDHSKHICCRHFESHCFDKPGELRPGAAPTLHLNHDDTNIFFSDYATGLPSSPHGNRIKDEPLESESDETLLV
ncbi:hypothetical protein KR054_002114 [Drosophila jambulina]|nr:hypothetical protein KR054_002114 [Drosophila jambulina]